MRLRSDILHTIVITETVSDRRAFTVFARGRTRRGLSAGAAGVAARARGTEKEFLVGPAPPASIGLIDVPASFLPYGAALLPKGAAATPAPAT